MKSIKIQLLIFALLDIILSISEIYELFHELFDPILLLFSLCALIGAVFILLSLKDHRYHKYAEIFSYINIAISAFSFFFSVLDKDPLMEIIFSLGELIIALYIHILLGRQTFAE